MKTITDLEGRILNAIAHHEMNSINGATPEAHHEVNTWSWADDFAREAGCDVKSAKGAMGSLTAKKLLWCSGSGREAAVGFTEEGFQAWKVFHNR